ncbi:MAG TPA: iron ABC transporter substrate-binding protein [Acidimicrobiales bacterium]|nr:iron ABC transporter substrate-binding protein [Acidimicrobiales bacterium]
MKRAVVLPLVVLAAALLAACGGDEDRLTIYSGRTSNLVAPLLEQFADETGISIDVRYGDSGDLALLIEQEGERTPADVFLSQSPGALGFLDQAGMLGTLPDDVLGLVDERFAADDGGWVGLSGRVRVLVYNTDDVAADELPGSVFDLVGEEYAGRVGLAPSNGSFQDFVTAMRADVGDDAALEWLSAMHDNDNPTFANNNAIVQAVARGEVEMGLVNHYYNERQLAEEPSSPSANHLFDDGDLGSMILATGAAVLDGTDMPEEAAARFVEFMLGEEAQTFFSEETFEYPLAAGVEPFIEDLPPLVEIAAPEVDLSALGGGFARTRELIEDAGFEG